MSISWKKIAAIIAVGAALAIGNNLLLKPEIIDYANVVLDPALAEELGADLPTRLQLARLGYNALDSAKGLPGVRLKAGDFADKNGHQTLERFGQKAFDLLSVEQRKRFYAMFKAREIEPVTYQTKSSTDGSKPHSFVITFGWKGSGFSESLGESEIRLRNAWQWIPNLEVALSLLDHENDEVNRAATKWLQKNSKAHRRLKSRSLQRLSKKARLAD